MSQQKLNLLKLAASGAAEFGTGAAEIVRRDARDAGCFRVGLDKLPDNFLAQAVASNTIRAIRRPE